MMKQVELLQKIEAAKTPRQIKKVRNLIEIAYDEYEINEDTLETLLNLIVEKKDYRLKMMESWFDERVKLAKNKYSVTGETTPTYEILNEMAVENMNRRRRGLITDSDYKFAREWIESELFY